MVVAETEAICDGLYVCYEVEWEEQPFIYWIGMKPLKMAPPLPWPDLNAKTIFTSRNQL
jgi:hypothetical protein